MWAERLRRSAIQGLPRLLLALALLFTLRILRSWAGHAVERMLKYAELSPELCRVLVRIARLTVALLGLAALLFILGLDGIAISFLTDLGITGLLLAFALQEIARNFASGLLLLFQRPFNIGDRIRVGDNEGIVQDIKLRATNLRTDDNREVLLPNSGVYTGTIVNLSRYPTRRFSQSFKLAAAAPLAEVLPVIEAATRSYESVCAEPQP